MKTQRLWIILLLLALLTPLGLWLPQRLGASGAWGEWGPNDLGDLIGFIPKGLARMANLWRAPAPDYAPAGWENRPLMHQSFAYVLSAVLGLALTGGIIWVLARWLARREEVDAS